MSLVNCGRVGCCFPIKLDRISCRNCAAIFHPECSNLCPEKFALKSRIGDWLCPTCIVSSTAPAGDCLIDVAPPECRQCNSFPIFYVTSNPNKLRETIQILGHEYAGMLKQVNVDLPEYQGSTPEEVARLKCDTAAKLVGGAVLVEDTCLAFDTLKGLPGPYIKWFLEAVGPEGLNRMLDGFRSVEKGEPCDFASAICTFAYSSGQEEERRVVVIQGVTRGRIVKPRGSRGFGWDACFEPLESAGAQTYAEMTAEAKNTISHRSRAVEKLRQLLDSLRSSSSSSPSSS